ncbi:MAG TPA: ABC transporter ATP-binding protein, partial [Gemmatimonadaceae bacterium]|nr:ABC transporter ATP-binding protein [Gemmatimonadaceae bacterium]
PAVLMHHIEKRFGATRADRDANLEVAEGEIHALVGENGAGKSTLMHVLAGLFPPDGGQVIVDGRDVTGWTTADAIAAGVGMVHQHFMLVPTLTIAENVVLGREPVRGVRLDMARANREVREVGERYGLAVDPRRAVKDLSVGEAQRVEILKTLFRGARILILDEPTAVLSPPEVRELWRVLRRLRESGGTIILITHKLDEVMDVSDRITVMRHGETVARMATHETTPAEIARAMVGREVALVAGSGMRDAGSGTAGMRNAGSGKRDGSSSDSLTPEVVPASRIPHPASLAVRGLTVSTPTRPRAVNDVSFAIAPGEILGIAGVEGNGQTELVEAIAGLRRAASGTITLVGVDGASRDVTTWDVRRRARAGLAHIPEDRHRRGLVLDYSVSDNLILGLQERFTHGLSLDRARIDANARAKIEAFDIRPPDPTLPARALSGGNQQKIVIAREMGGDFSVLLAAQPTRGVDVGAIEFTHARLREARNAGKAILLVSAELGEILALSDRIAVMYAGRIVQILLRAEANEESLGLLMTGAKGSAGDVLHEEIDDDTVANRVITP